MGSVEASNSVVVYVHVVVVVVAGVFDVVVAGVFDVVVTGVFDVVVVTTVAAVNQPTNLLKLDLCRGS